MDLHSEAKIPRDSDVESTRAALGKYQLSTNSPKRIGECRSRAQNERSQQPKVADNPEQ